ncbi:MAG: hypothetical protein ACOX3E_00060 [Desulfomonilia bacterium]
MKGHRILSHIAAIFFLACVCVSCESSSSNTDPGNVLPPTGKLDLVGSWAGYFVSGADDAINPNAVDDGFLDFDEDDIFAIGVITQEREARFVGDASQFVCPQGSLSVNYTLPNRTIFGGVLDYYTWNTLSPDPYAANVEHISIYGEAFLSIYFLNGVHWYTDTPEADRDFWQFQFFNYTTTGISADIEKIAGQWQISDAFREGNTLTFTITPNSDGEAAITGTDTQDPQNTFEGTIIEIHYDDDVHGTDLYRVSLTLNDDASDPLEGLATYVSSYDTQGIHTVSSLAIGVSGGDRMVTGIAAPVIVP